MSDLAVRVQGLGKQYRIGVREPYQTLRATLTDTAIAPFRRVKSLVRGQPWSSARTDLIWALKDVSFDVPRGAVVGIIGPNGAGKSTFLKILSRITEPTEGEVEIRGRVGSLLEVGTGFHSELTGRENVFLNGAILGMRRAEIARKFDEIVAFAEVETFLDTAVKYYSTGMYMRLAFAVAAHLEPEILVVDEVLSVGDAQFQKKCLGKMGDVAKQGRTVLFVSHNLPTVESLCNRCVLLRQGRVYALGDPATIVSRYLTGDLPPASAVIGLANHPNRTRGSSAVLQRLCIGPSDAAAIPMGGSLTVEVEFQSNARIRPVLDIIVKTASGSTLFGTNNEIASTDAPLRPLRSGVLKATFERLPLLPGTYVIDLYLHDGYDAIDSIPDAGAFEVVAADVNGTGRLWWDGPFWVPATFEIAEQRRPAESLALGIAG